MENTRISKKKTVVVYYGNRTHIIKPVALKNKNAIELYIKDTL